MLRFASPFSHQPSPLSSRLRFFWGVGVGLMNIEALCAAPPEAQNQAFAYADTRQGRHSHDAGQATEPPPTPTRTEEQISTLPGCRPAGRSAFAHADTPNTSPGCRSFASAPSPAAARPHQPARADEKLRTSPGCRPRHASRPRTRRLAPKKTSPRAPL